MYIVNWTPFVKKKESMQKSQVETCDLVVMPPLCEILTGEYNDDGKRRCAKLMKYTRKGIQVECWTEYEVSETKKIDSQIDSQCYHALTLTVMHTQPTKAVAAKVSCRCDRVAVITVTESLPHCDRVPTPPTPPR